MRKSNAWRCSPINDKSDLESKKRDVDLKEMMSTERMEFNGRYHSLVARYSRQECSVSYFQDEMIKHALSASDAKRELATYKAGLRWYDLFHSKVLA
jgi:hypothetical protein